MSLNKIKLPSTPCQIAEVEVFLKKLSTKYQITSEVYPNMLISLTEAVNNAIIHGNRNDAKKFVRISYQEKGRALVFKISDEGEGFNPKDIPNPTAHDHIECCGGRGVYIMTSLSDDIVFKKNGRIVLLKFNIKS